MRLRKIVVFGRLLARLVMVDARGWALKGALALDFRLHPRARTTKDMDLAHRAGEEHVSTILRRAQEVDLEDFFVFQVTRTGFHSEDSDEWAQYQVHAELAARQFEIVTIHVGLSDQLPWITESLKVPQLLGFAGIPSVIVPALGLEQHVAEKVHAYTRTYGRRLIVSTRPKDLVDIVLICEIGHLSARGLRNALVTTFEQRATHTLPTSFPPPPARWTTQYRRLASEVGIDPDLGAGYNKAAKFINPVIGGSAKGRWNPVRGAWE